MGGRRLTGKKEQVMTAALAALFEGQTAVKTQRMEFAYASPPSRRAELRTALAPTPRHCTTLMPPAAPCGLSPQLPAEGDGRELVMILDYRAKANAYCTPAHADGCAGHHGRHDQFVHQVAGMVAWRFFFFQAEDGIRDRDVTGVQTCALPI